MEALRHHDACAAVAGLQSVVHGSAMPEAPTAIATSTDWRAGLPVIAAQDLTLRELRLSDAPALLAMLNTEGVSRFISPPPTTVEGFERFIEWTLEQRRAGTYVCFGVVPRGCDSAIGLFQVRALEPNFATAEWGFVLGAEYWGTGAFVTGARLVLGFAFKTLRVHRMEARAAVENGRGNGALRKLGAVPEARLRGSFLRRGKAHDQVLWTILASEFPPRAHSESRVH